MSNHSYLECLNNDDLLDFLEDAIRHSHYCPCECHCFDDWKNKIKYPEYYNISKIKEEIKERINENT